jgi:hypothetical protein
MSAPFDELRGRQAFRDGIPYSTTENIDWQLGWQNAADDRRMDEEEEQANRDNSQFGVGA